MANKTLLFNSDAGSEVTSVQTLQQRLNQISELGGDVLTEMSNRILARDKDGKLVSNPVLSNILNTDFVSVIRQGINDSSWITFATTSNDENKTPDPEHSLLVSLNDLLLTIKVPNDVSSVTTEPLSKEEPNPDYDDQNPESEETITVDIDALCKYYGKPITLDALDEQSVLWKLVSERTVRLHKNNGQSVSGTWALDLERINKRTPDVLFLNVTPEEELLAVSLDPSKVQTIPVTFTSDDNQDVFNLILFINTFDLRTAQKQFKISNSVEGSMFLTPWVIASTIDEDTMTGAIHEGGLLKTEGLTNSVSAVDVETGLAVEVDVKVINTHAGFNTTGELDSVKLPSVPSVFNETDQSKNLVEEGTFTIKAEISAEGYETKVVDLSVCINNEDERPEHLTLVLSHDLVEYLNTKKHLVNSASSATEISCTSRHGESDEVVFSELSISGISGLDDNVSKSVTSTVVNKLGAESKTVYVTTNEDGVVKAFILVKCESEGYVTEVLKLQLAVDDDRLPDGEAKWSLTWATKPSVTIPATEDGAKGDELKAVVSSLGLNDALVATTGTITGNKMKNQWGQEEEIDSVVVGVVDRNNPLSEKTCDVVDIPQNAYDDIGCWLNLSILSKSGFIVVKKVQATVTDSRS